MSYLTLLTNLGFEADPFLKTNADEEDRLESYFVEPPFFDAVYGDLRRPKSVVVFAPRGGGKTALKRSIEIASANQPILCISYNYFDITSVTLAEVDQQYHLKNLLQLVLVGILSQVYLRGAESLSDDDRRLLSRIVTEHLSGIDKSRLKNSIDNVKNLSDKAKEFWNKFLGPVGFVLNAVLERAGLGKAEINKFESDRGSLGSLRDRLRVLQQLGTKIGFGSIYILIDKIDETNLTSLAQDSYRFVAPLLNDLQLLETPGYAFKFFLWDLLLDYYRSTARPDRVNYYTLGWRDEDLLRMLSFRLRAYSKTRPISFATISDAHFPVPIDLLIATFAQGSPRNLLRICKEILDQQSNIDPSVKKISQDAIEKGVNQIADKIAHELYTDRVIKDLQRTQHCDLTIRNIYQVFDISQQAAQSKVRIWENASSIQLLGTVKESKKAKSSNHYGLTNILLAKHVFSQMTLSEFISNKTRACSHCGAMLLRDWNLRAPQRCHLCQHEVS